MRETVAISAGNLQAEIVPSLGAGLARFDIIGNGRREPILRPWPERGTDDPNNLAAYVLVPWSNRISDGGFTFRGEFHPLEPNVPPEPFPLHGNGWMSEWALVERAPDRAELHLASEGPGPYRYQSKVIYLLTSTGLSVHLEVTNRAAIALPFGLGLHPWLPRTLDTRLQAHAKTVWLEDERHLPTRKISASEYPEWNFDLPRPLPDDWINNGFDGWNGNAKIEWPSRGISLSIETFDALGTYILYSPGRDAAFFCLEPVSHVVDAHNLPGGPEANGLVILAPNEKMEVRCGFSPTLAATVGLPARTR